ncbi:MAG: dihydroneopterin aldolase family protein [Halobacteriaceae archaeon]
MEITEVHTACFEAGIKFGSLYHQFAGTPVSPASMDSLATAIEESIENQPFCKSVSVSIDEEKLANNLDNGYTELTGKFLQVEISIEYEDTEVTAQMEMKNGYPKMELTSITA